MVLSAGGRGLLRNSAELATGICAGTSPVRATSPYALLGSAELDEFPSLIGVFGLLGYDVTAGIIVAILGAPGS